MSKIDISKVLAGFLVRSAKAEGKRLARPEIRQKLKSQIRKGKSVFGGIPALSEPAELRKVNTSHELSLKAVFAWRSGPFKIWFWLLL